MAWAVYQPNVFTHKFRITTIQITGFLYARDLLSQKTEHEILSFSSILACLFHVGTTDQFCSPKSSLTISWGFLADWTKELRLQRHLMNCLLLLRLPYSKFCSCVDSTETPNSQHKHCSGIKLFNSVQGGQGTNEGGRTIGALLFQSLSPTYEHVWKIVCIKTIIYNFSWFKG